MTDKKNTANPPDPKHPHPTPYSDRGLPPVQHTPGIPPVKPPKEK